MTETGVLMGGAIFLAYVVKGITGFGNTLVFSSIVGLFLDNRNISPVELVVGYPSNLLIAWREIRYIYYYINKQLRIVYRRKTCKRYKIILCRTGLFFRCTRLAAYLVTSYFRCSAGTIFNGLEHGFF